MSKKKHLIPARKTLNKAYVSKGEVGIKIYIPEMRPGDFGKVIRWDKEVDDGREK